MQFVKVLLYTLCNVWIVIICIQKLSYWAATAPVNWRIRLNSSDNLVTAVYGDVDLLHRIHTVMEGNKQVGGGVAAKALFEYPLLLSKMETV